VTKSPVRHKLYRVLLTIPLRSSSRQAGFVLAQYTRPLYSDVTSTESDVTYSTLGVCGPHVIEV
jgi:hypothetical protein